jgi:hypothetical protein
MAASKSNPPRILINKAQKGSLSRKMQLQRMW